MYELTDIILSQFKAISPALYNELDGIRDKMNRETDIYVKVISPDEARVSAFGTTNVDAVKGDKDAYQSEFGPHSVSIRIWNVTRAMWVLAHEFGHARYQIQNLRSYMEFYRKTYGYNDKLTYFGHAPRDPSGESAHSAENEFQKGFNLLSNNASTAIEFPSTVVERVRRRIHADKRGYFMMANSGGPQ